MSQCQYVCVCARADAGVHDVHVCVYVHICVSLTGLRPPISMALIPLGDAPPTLLVFTKANRLDLKSRQPQSENHFCDIAVERLNSKWQNAF